LILLNAFFVAAEYGLVTSRRTRIRELEREGNRRARDVLRITSDPPRFISAMQLGVTLTSLAIGALGEPVLAHRFEPLIATALGGGAADAALELGRAGRDRARRAGDGDPRLRLRRQAGERRDGRAAGGRGALDRAAPGGGAARGARVALHALPRLPRERRRHHR